MADAGQSASAGSPGLLASVRHPVALCERELPDAEETGVPARTIRFYIARGLLPGPQHAGHGAIYGEVHGKWLQEIKQLQAKGLTLNEIARSFGDSEKYKRRCPK